MDGIVLMGDYDGSVGLSCNRCPSPNFEGAILTLHEWSGEAPLSEVNEIAARHEAEVHHA